jgi:Zn-dependent protease with chaperone function
MSESGRPRTRRVERSALTALLPVVVIVPVWLIAMLIVWLPLRFVFGLPFWIVPAIWLALAGLLFVPGIQIALLGRFLGTRPPSEDELAVIAPIWRDLAAKANLPQYRYAVRVLDSDELNAFACGGHLVVVTSFAIEELTTRELSGVLAHELSHHLGLHTAALTLGHWLSLPVLLLARIGFFLQNVARAATDAFVSHSAALTALGRLLAALLTAVSWVFLAALYASDAMSNTVGRGAEFEADRRAVRMGYGKPLADALREVIRLGGGVRPIGWRARLATSHPPARTRVARIEAMLRHPSY